MRKNDPQSLLMLVLSMAIFGSIGIFRRYIPLSSAALACFRGTCGALVLFGAAKLQKRKLRNGIGSRKILGLVFTGAMIGLNWMLLFEAYRYTTVPTATLCYYMQPTIVMLASPWVFGEKLTGKKGLCAALSLFGMVLVSGVMENGMPRLSEMKGILFGLGAAALYAAVVIMNKKLPGVDAYEKTVIQLLAAAGVLIPYLLIAKEPLPASWSLTEGLMLAVVGVVHTGLAYALYFGSMDGLRAQTVAIVSYLDPVVALLLSALILHEGLTPAGVVGAAMILGAAFVSEMNGKKTARKPSV